MNRYRLPAALVTASNALAGISLLYLGGLFVYHLQLIREPLPLDVFEPAVHIMTGVIAAGGNPYSFEYLPVYAYIYPPLYNLLAAPFTLLFDNSVLLHRSLSAICIIACCCLLYRALKTLALESGYALAGAGLLYAALLHYNTPIASGNALGQLLFMTCILWPMIKDFSPGSLRISAIAGVLAFFCKQYFLLGPAITGLYLLLTAPWRLSLRYAVQVALLLSLSLSVTVWLAPYYLDTTLFAVRAAAALASDEAHLFRQLRAFAEIYAALLLVLLAATVALCSGYRPSRKLVLPGLALLCASAAVIISLGHNSGNYLTYLLQLMSPFLIVTTLGLLASYRRRSIVLAPALVFSFWTSWQLLPAHKSPDHSNWLELGHIISQHDAILADGTLAHLILEQGKTLYQGPLTRWFHVARFKPAQLLRRDPERQVAGITDAYIRRLNQSIADKAFDLVLLRPKQWDMIGAQGWPFAPRKGEATFKANYYLADTLVLPYPQRPGGGKRTIEIWKPRES